MRGERQKRERERERERNTQNGEKVVSDDVPLRSAWEMMSHLLEML